MAASPPPGSDRPTVRLRPDTVGVASRPAATRCSVLACQPRCRKIGSISAQVRRMAIASVSSSNLWPGRSRTRSASAAENSAKPADNSRTNLRCPRGRLPRKIPYKEGNRNLCPRFAFPQFYGTGKNMHRVTTNVHAQGGPTSAIADCCVKPCAQDEATCENPGNSGSTKWHLSPSYQNDITAKRILIFLLARATSNSLFYWTVARRTRKASTKHTNNTVSEPMTIQTRARRGPSKLGSGKP